MRDYYCFDIEFENVDFDDYFIKCEKVSKTHQAHLLTHENEIELRIFYDHKTYFGEKLSMWTKAINWREFGSFIKLSNESQNNRLQKIDLSGAKLCGFSTSTSYYENDSKYIKLKIDTAKFYWNPNDEKLNTAEFYFHDEGFRVVEPFYSILFGFNGNFNISRMKDADVFYKLGKSDFRPEFHTYSRDDIKNREAKVIKEPKIQFNYNESVTENEAVFYGEVVRYLASFYHHLNIGYSLCRIHLKEYSITVKRIEEKKLTDIRGNLWAFNIHWDFNKFLQKEWQTGTIKNYKLLFKAIELFNQALLVDSNSEFLIRYNLLEICNNLKTKSEKFKLIVNGNTKKKKYKEALKSILETIDSKDHKSFINKWNSLSGKLEYKPIKSPLISFLESQGFQINEFPISIEKLKILRDNITHGSINKVDSAELRKANKFLYRINGILILNLIGINEWKLNTELK